MKSEDRSRMRAFRAATKSRVLAAQLLALVMIGSVLAGLAGPVSAADNRAMVLDSLEGAPVGTCIVTATTEGFRVDWKPSPIFGDFAVIERKVFGEFNWRARVESSEGTFIDETTPPSASRIEYRITQEGRSQAGTTCDVASTPEMTCFQTLNDEGYTLDWSGGSGPGIDYVVKRRFPIEGDTRAASPVTRHWRGRTDDTTFSDSISAKGPAQYQVIARLDRKIVGSTFCDDPAQECATWQLLPAASELPENLKPAKRFVSLETPGGRTYSFVLRPDETRIGITHRSGFSEQTLLSRSNDRVPWFFATAGERLFVRLGSSAETLAFDPTCHSSDDPAPILAAIASVETGGDYLSEPDEYTQSGAYAISEELWQNFKQFRHAYQAPEATQDAKATAMVNRILANNLEDVTAVPVAWLLGGVPEQDDPAWDEPAPTKPDTTPREYQEEWMRVYRELVPINPTWAGVSREPTVQPAGLPEDAPRPKVTDAELWVSPNGDNSNPGTEQRPLRNLQAAVNRAAPGTTIQVQTGTYNRVEIAKSGTPDAWIVLTAAPGADPKIVATQGEGVRLRGAYLAVNGFTIQGVGGSDDPGGSGYGYGILASNYKSGNLTDVHHIYLTNNEVSGWSTGGIATGWANWIVVAGNYVHHNSNWGREGGSGISFLESTNAGGAPAAAGFTQWIIGNTVTENRQLVPSTLIGSNEKLDGNGIILDRLDIGGFDNRTLVAHNFVANNGGRGSHAYRSSNVEMVNNTLYHNGEYVNGELSAYNSNDVMFVKNLVIPRPGRSAYFGKGIDAGNNMLLDSDTDPDTLADTAKETGTGAQEIG